MKPPGKIRKHIDQSADNIFRVYMTSDQIEGFLGDEQLLDEIIVQLGKAKNAIGPDDDDSAYVVIQMMK